MNEILTKEISTNKEGNEIFYSLTDYDIQSIYELINLTQKDWIEIPIEFQEEEIDEVFKLLSTTYNLPNKNEIDLNIWENFLANKIMTKLIHKSGIPSTQNFEKERKLLMSFDIEEYLLHFSEWTNMQKVEDWIRNFLKKKVRIHYFPATIMPINLQKIIGKILTTPFSFTNMLYTTQSNIRSYYKPGKNWILQNNDYKEIWKFYIN